jgi:hypothetical protein
MHGSQFAIYDPRDWSMRILVFVVLLFFPLRRRLVLTDFRLLYRGTRARLRLLTRFSCSSSRVLRYGLISPQRLVSFKQLKFNNRLLHAQASKPCLERTLVSYEISQEVL